MVNTKPLTKSVAATFRFTPDMMDRLRAGATSTGQNMTQYIEDLVDEDTCMCFAHQSAREHYRQSLLEFPCKGGEKEESKDV